MPGFDGTGPDGEGPFTGRGEGYCAMRLPKPGSDEPMIGYVGLQGSPFQVMGRPLQMRRPLPALTPFPVPWPGYRPCYGRKAARHRGRRFGRNRW